MRKFLIACAILLVCSIVYAGPTIEHAWQSAKQVFSGDFSGIRAYNSTSYLRIGNSGGSPSVAASTGDVWFNVANFEVDSTGAVRFDSSGGVVFNAIEAYGVQAITPSGATTLTPTRSYVTCACSVASCAVTMGESGMADGNLVTITGGNTNTCTFADTVGVSELAGAFSMGQYDVLRLIYVSDRWVELARVNN